MNGRMVEKGEKKAVPFRNDTNGAIKGNTNCVL